MNTHDAHSALTSIGEALGGTVTVLGPILIAAKKLAKSDKEREGDAKARETSFIDQVQEECRQKTSELAALNAILVQERALTERLHEEKLREQDDRHERKSILRTYETRCRDAGIDCDDLVARAKSLETKT